MSLRTLLTEIIWPRNEPKMTVGTTSCGSMVQAHSDVAISPNANPEMPWMKPATSAPPTICAATDASMVMPGVPAALPCTSLDAPGFACDIGVNTIVYKVVSIEHASCHEPILR